MTSKDKRFFIIYAPVSLGELIDKITILEIKKEHITGSNLRNVDKELELLKFTLQEENLDIDTKLVNQLKKVNNSLWEIEDNIRLNKNDSSSILTKFCSKYSVCPIKSF